MNKSESNKEKFKQYCEEFSKLNQEEKILNKNVDTDELDKFFIKKNKTALKFINDINNGELLIDDLDIGYYISNNDNTVYYDKIYINIDDENSFCILPSTILQMDNGQEELYNLMANHINTVLYDNIYDEEDLIVEHHPLFVHTQDSPSTYIDLTNYMNDLNYESKKFQDILNDDKLNQIKEKIEKAEIKSNDIIKEDIEKYQITEDQAKNILENFKYYNPDFKKDLIDDLINQYGVNILNSKALSDIDTKDYQRGKDNVTEFLYNNSSNFNKNCVLQDFPITEDLFTEVMKDSKYAQLDAIANNKNLTESQIIAIKDKTIELDKSEDNKTASDILSSLLKSHTIPEDYIKELYASDNFKSSIIQNCKNIPSEIIEELKVNEKNAEYLVNQKNISEDTLNEIFDSYHSSIIAKEFLKRDSIPNEIFQKMTNDSYMKDTAIKAVLQDKVTDINEETIRKLALDPKVDEKLRLEFMNSPKYKESLPQLEEKDLEFEFSTRDVIFGKPFDNRGGERRYIINGKCIQTEKGMGSSNPIGSQWARDAYTDFSLCSSQKEFEYFCNKHKEAIAILRKNGEIYSKKGLSQRVDIVEKLIEKEKNMNSKENVKKDKNYISVEELGNIKTTTKDIDDFLQEASQALDEQKKEI